MEDKFPITQKTHAIRDRVTWVSTIQKACLQRLQKTIISLDPTNSNQDQMLLNMCNTTNDTELQRRASALLNKEEQDRLLAICALIGIESSVTIFSSASKDNEITQQAQQCVLDLLEGKKSLAETKKQLDVLKEKDKQNTPWLSFFRDPYWRILSPAFLGILNLGGILAITLMLTLIPATWPLVAVFIAPITLGGLIYTFFLLHMDIQYRQECLNNAWDGYIRDGINTTLNKLTEDDIVLLKKVHSPEWIQEFETLKTAVTPASAKPTTSQSPLAPHSTEIRYTNNTPAIKKLSSDNTAKEKMENEIKKLEMMKDPSYRPT